MGFGGNGTGNNFKVIRVINVYICNIGRNYEVGIGKNKFDNIGLQLC